MEDEGIEADADSWLYSQYGQKVAPENYIYSSIVYSHDFLSISTVCTYSIYVFESILSSPILRAHLYTTSLSMLKL